MFGPKFIPQVFSPHNANVDSCKYIVRCLDHYAVTKNLKTANLLSTIILANACFVLFRCIKTVYNSYVFQCQLEIFVIKYMAAAMTGDEETDGQTSFRYIIH